MQITDSLCSVVCVLLGYNDEMDGEVVWTLERRKQSHVSFFGTRLLPVENPFSAKPFVRASLCLISLQSTESTHARTHMKRWHSFYISLFLFLFPPYLLPSLLPSLLLSLVLFLVLFRPSLLPLSSLSSHPTPPIAIALHHPRDIFPYRLLLVLHSPPLLILYCTVCSIEQEKGSFLVPPPPPPTTRSSLVPLD